jgi:hypothetical protein
MRGYRDEGRLEDLEEHLVGQVQDVQVCLSDSDATAR